MLRTSSASLVCSDYAAPAAPAVSQGEMMRMRRVAWANMTPEQRAGKVNTAIGRFLDWALQKQVNAARWDD